MAAYPGFGWGEAETDNSVLWDPGLFELVSGSKFTITFMGRPRPQPIVRLRHLATGREFYVVNTHPSAGDGKYAAERANGHNTLVSVVNGLKGEGLPVLVTGDMNARAEFYCRVVPAAGLTASNGGSYANGCAPPPEPLPVDWVVGSGTAWSGYWRDTGPVEQKVSDHFFISATATFD
jgi:endonuclease/exonuclease/phosphatase family metal-dependent hydrolase